MFKRATFIPAATSLRIMSGDSVAGPSVATIFVRLIYDGRELKCAAARAKQKSQ
jgi:hypothetical protein